MKDVLFFIGFSQPFYWLVSIPALLAADYLRARRKGYRAPSAVLVPLCGSAAASSLHTYLLGSCHPVLCRPVTGYVEFSLQLGTRHVVSLSYHAEAQSLSLRPTTSALSVRYYGLGIDCGWGGSVCSLLSRGPLARCLAR